MKSNLETIYQPELAYHINHLSNTGTSRMLSILFFLLSSNLWRMQNMKVIDNDIFSTFELLWDMHLGHWVHVSAKYIMIKLTCWESVLMNHFLHGGLMFYGTWMGSVLPTRDVNPMLSFFDGYWISTWVCSENFFQIQILNLFTDDCRRFFRWLI
jgi:hypothetical protein